MQGVIESVSSKGNSIKVGGEWYSCFNAAQLCGATQGDEVSFDYIQKGQYKNIKGNVKKVGGGGAPAGSASTPAARPFGPPVRHFPVPATAPERAINRQNALTNAVNAVSHWGFKGDDLTEYSNTVIEVARMFEAYTTGDIDLQEAKAMLGGAVE